MYFLFFFFSLFFFLRKRTVNTKDRDVLKQSDSNRVGSKISRGGKRRGEESLSNVDGMHEWKQSTTVADAQSEHASGSDYNTDDSAAEDEDEEDISKSETEHPVIGARFGLGDAVFVVPRDHARVALAAKARRKKDNAASSAAASTTSSTTHIPKLGVPLVRPSIPSFLFFSLLFSSQ